MSQSIAKLLESLTMRARKQRPAEILQIAATDGFAFACFNDRYIDRGRLGTGNKLSGSATGREGETMVISFARRPPNSRHHLVAGQVHLVGHPVVALTPIMTKEV
jgi:hypothetical protein